MVAGEEGTSLKGRTRYTSLKWRMGRDIIAVQLRWTIGAGTRLLAAMSARSDAVSRGSLAARPTTRSEFPEEAGNMGASQAVRAVPRSMY